jgi:hypothetical protein
MEEQKENDYPEHGVGPADPEARDRELEHREPEMNLNFFKGNQIPSAELLQPLSLVTLD